MLLATLLNVRLMFEPRAVVAAMIATEISAAIRPYSMAVAPESSFRKRAKSVMRLVPLGAEDWSAVEGQSAIAMPGNRGAPLARRRHDMSVKEVLSRQFLSET
jgi:hypothetical protein